MHLKNVSNEYVGSLERGLFERIPKAVWAAIAISFATTGGDYLENASDLIMAEWQALYDAGIVPQKPIRKG